MAFTPKSWQDSPSTSTPISAAALADIETRVTNYTDTSVSPLTSYVGQIAVNVKSAPYGATGDGVTDDTTAILAAIAAALILGAPVYFPPGTFIVSAPLRFAGFTNLKVYGHSATIKLKDSVLTGANSIPIIDLSGCTGALVEGLRINGNRVNQAGYLEWNHGIAIAVTSGDTGCTDVTIRNCTVFNTAGDNICIGFYGTTTGVLIEGCDVSDPNTGGAANPRQGVALVNCSDVRIIGNRFSGTSAAAGRMAIDIEPDAGLTVSNVTITGNVFTAGWNRTMAVSSTSSSIIRNITFSDNDCEKYVRVEKVAGGLIENIKINNNRITQGIRAESVVGISIVGNTVNGRDQDIFSTSVIYVTDCEQYVINDNLVDIKTGDGAATGVNVLGGSNQGTIVGNLFFPGSNSMTAIKVAGNGTGCLIQGNHGAGTGGVAMAVGIDVSGLSGGTMWVIGPNSFKYNVTAPISGLPNAAVAAVRGMLTGSTTWDPGSLIVGASERKSVAVTGAAVGDPAHAGLTTIAATGWDITAAVISSNTVEVKITNNTAGTVDLGSGTVKVAVEKV